MIIGSRESKLAVLQSEMVKKLHCMQASREENAGSGITVNILTMKTTGDKILDRTLDKVGGKGLFVKELDRRIAGGQKSVFLFIVLRICLWKSRRSSRILAFSKREDRKRCAGSPKRL
ncbi:MAG: hypothetical protein ACLTBK_09385 [Blautia wexlerae]